MTAGHCIGLLPRLIFRCAKDHLLAVFLSLSNTVRHNISFL